MVRFGSSSIRACLVLFLLSPAYLWTEETENALSRHREKLGVLGWHAAGYRGKGVKICILDTDFAGYRVELGETLPTRVRVRSFRRDGRLEVPGSGHGLRAAQVIHALAPGAELLLANWDSSSPRYFLDAVRWARDQGARIITCSVTSADWGDGEGGGPVHRQFEQLLGKGTSAEDPLFFCSAGNMVQGHWTGRFSPGPDHYHEWKPGQVENPLSPWAEVPVKVSLLHKPGVVYEVSIHQGAHSEPIARQLSLLEGDLVGIALSFTPRRGASYSLRIRHLSGMADTFHCVVRQASLGVHQPMGSICCFPADNAAVVTVGAVDWTGKRIDYSAYGGTAPCLKPELVAPVPFPCPKREWFSGTSAAAPQAAALAGLLAERYPQWTARQLRDALLAGLRPLGPGGYQPETGYGQLVLPPVRGKAQSPR